MAILHRKLKKQTKHRRKYIDYYKQRKRRGERALTYGQWTEARTLTRGMEHLSPGDYKAARRILMRKKKR